VSPAETSLGESPLSSMIASTARGSSPRSDRSRPWLPSVASAGPGALRACRHSRGHSATTSSQPCTSLAPSWIRAWVPRLPGAETLPGTAYTSRPSSPAHRGGLDDHRPEREPRDDAVPRREVLGQGRGPHGELGDHGTRVDDLRRQATVLGGIHHVDTRTQDGDRPAPRADGPPMGGRVHPARESAHDRDAAVRQVATEPLGHLDPIGRCPARSDDGDGQGVLSAKLAPHQEEGRGQVDGPEGGRVVRVTKENQARSAPIGRSGLVLRGLSPVERRDRRGDLLTRYPGKGVTGRPEYFCRRAETQEVVISPPPTDDWAHQGQGDPRPSLVGRRPQVERHHGRLRRTKHVQSKRHDIHPVGASSRKRTIAPTLADQESSVRTRG
jgi:hypothetical protein